MLSKRTKFMAAICLFLILAAVLAGCSSRENSSASSASQSTLDKINKSGTLTVAVFSDVPPWGFYDSNHQLTGLDVDVANAMGQALGVKVNFVPTTNENRIPYLVTKKVDCVVASFSIHSDRRKVVDISEPYVISGAILVINTQNPNSASITGVGDLKGKTIAVAKGSFNDQLITQLAGSTAKDILRFDNVSDAYEALKEGKADAVCEDALGTAYLIKTQYPTLKIVGSLLSNDYEGIGVYPGDQRWLNWVNGFVEFDLLRNGEMKNILNKYGMPYTPVNTVY